MKWNQITESKPSENELVLCAGGGGGYFLGYWHRDNMFYVPNYRDGYRKAVAWAKFDRYKQEERGER